MEQLDREINRQQQKINNSNQKPVEVRSVTDIKRIISEYNPEKNPSSPVVSLKTQMEIKDGSSAQTYAVSANTQSKSKRDHLIEGLLVIEKRMLQEQKIDEYTEPTEINGRSVTPPQIGSGVSGYSWVDPLIHQWLGASRDGIIIYWDIDDGYRYKYNIFEHKLSRVRRDGSTSASSIL